MQLAYINRENKTIKIVGDRRFIAEFAYNRDGALTPELIESLRSDDYSEPFVES